MKEPLTSSKSLGESLDLTFTLSKKYFSSFIVILLVLIGPIYALQAIVQLLFGVNFFRELGEGSNWIDQIASSFEVEMEPTASLPIDNWLLVLGIASFVLYPVAQAAIILAINYIRKKETFTVKGVIKEAFALFWNILGGSILYFLIVIGFIFVPSILLVFIVIFSMTFDTVFSIILSILVGVGFLIATIYFLTRWSFFLGSIVLDDTTPGLGRSWTLTKRRVWATIVFYVILMVILGIIVFALEALFGALLGNSVLFNLIRNVVTLVTTLFFSVGYTVKFLDLRVRQGAEDLKEMIEEYEPK
ncbi:glycerophosphoryl diester phosphodiesterase membrane domain-containing protein [Bacillus suaedae]|uniref:Glycerophosphoryl diester phosphodiesterase membrane domain-containing protein n=1 Tax=Halalkalibacter suaedae TaxID=2822140 RepID=A0A940WUG2_9BACI|nr:glycerophosphoryl diester phosphodiesterase membrane domain-containing protein [Bacillus suaedae]MBP3952670.1 glycerophosphoryl diester phosphodiesterase membrane domain-containing protein [Bacillus suaedae]